MQRRLLAGVCRGGGGGVSCNTRNASAPKPRRWRHVDLTVENCTYLKSRPDGEYARQFPTFNFPRHPRRSQPAARAHVFISRGARFRSLAYTERFAIFAHVCAQKGEIERRRGRSSPSWSPRVIMALLHNGKGWMCATGWRCARLLYVKINKEYYGSRSAIRAQLALVSRECFSFISAGRLN